MNSAERWPRHGVCSKQGLTAPFQGCACPVFPLLSLIQEDGISREAPPAPFDARLEAKPDYFAEIGFNSPPLKAPWSSLRSCPGQLWGSRELRALRDSPSCSCCCLSGAELFPGHLHCSLGCSSGPWGHRRGTGEVNPLSRVCWGQLQPCSSNPCSPNPAAPIPAAPIPAAPALQLQPCIPNPCNSSPAFPIPAAPTLQFRQQHCRAAPAQIIGLVFTAQISGSEEGNPTRFLRP